MTMLSAPLARFAEIPIMTRDLEHGVDAVARKRGTGTVAATYIPVPRRFVPRSQSPFFAGETRGGCSILAIPHLEMAKRSNYQDRVIRNYYQNRDEIMLQRLGELVTDLFLSEGKAKSRLWKRVAEILEKLKIPKDQIQHIVRSDNPTLVANVLKKLLEKSE